MFWDRPLEHALSNLKKRVNAPVRVVLWDGREVAFSEETRVTVRLKGARAASALVNPSFLSLAEAYIEGHADLEGEPVASCWNSIGVWGDRSCPELTAAIR